MWSVNARRRTAGCIPVRSSSTCTRTLDGPARLADRDAWFGGSVAMGPRDYIKTSALVDPERKSRFRAAVCYDAQNGPTQEGGPKERRMFRASRWVATIVAGAMMALTVGSLAGCNLLKPKKKGAFNEACQNDIDCESMSCSPYGSICTKDCTYDKDCGGDLVCRAKDIGTGDYCS